jgi:hypothetical protein
MGNLLSMTDRRFPIRIVHMIFFFLKGLPGAENALAAAVRI